MRRLALLLAVTTLALAAPSQASAADNPRVSYKPPVEGPITDEWRPPPDGIDWTGGANRGIDYTPGAGTPVKAAADGEVVFAGQVGGRLHVVVLHADGIRTSYSFLQSIAVHRGQRVVQGQVVGTSEKSLHFGARVGDKYIDPTSLFDGGPPHVFLVPDEARKPGTEAEERSGLRRFLEGVVDTVKKGGELAIEAPMAGARGIISDFYDEFEGIVHYGLELHPVTHAARLARTSVDWWRQSRDCTPASVAPPPLPEERVAVLVAGLGSNSESDSVEAVNPAALGYDGFVRFSYNGGSTTESPYGPADTTTDLRTQAKRLKEVLQRVQAQHPGKAVDLIAHSQGGIIARTALAYEYDPKDPTLPRVANLVTLASPHTGTDAATALGVVGLTEVGNNLERGLHNRGVLEFDPRGESISQLSETSEFMYKLNRRALPEGVRFTSIGSRGDIMVPGNHTRVKDGRNVIVSLAGKDDHKRLPGSDEGRREVALAVGGAPPTCQTFTNMMADTLVSDVISTGEDLAGAAAYAGAKFFDGKLEGE